MVERERVVESIFDAIETLNRQLRKGQKLEKSTQVILIGERSELDSLGLINFILTVEHKIEDYFQETITLTEQSLIRTEDSPLQTVGTLVDYISAQLENRGS